MKLRLLSLLLVSVLSAPLSASAQRSTSYGVVAGYHGMTHHYLEIGGGFATSNLGRRGGIIGGSFSAEMRVSDGFILGGTYSIWTSSNPLAAGFSLSYFNNLHGDGTLRFRPEVGLGLGFVRVVYGYSIGLSGRSFAGVNDHDIALRAFVPILPRR